MKKMIAIICTLILLTVNAVACDAPVLPVEPEGSASTVSGVYTDCTWWVISREYSELIGIVSPAENVPAVASLGGCVTHIRGVMSDGPIRVKGRANIVETAETVVGLTEIRSAAVWICPTYAGIVEEIVTRRTGKDVSGASIIASTIWRAGCTVSHIFFLHQAVFQVGTVTVGSDTILIWCGDFDGDGLAELGFTAGTNDYYVAPTATPAPTAKPTRKPDPQPTSKPQTEFVNPTPAPQCGCPEKTECADVFKLCFKFCITVTKTVKESITDCGCK